MLRIRRLSVHAEEAATAATAAQAAAKAEADAMAAEADDADAPALGEHADGDGDEHDRGAEGGADASKAPAKQAVRAASKPVAIGGVSKQVSK